MTSVPSSRLSDCKICRRGEARAHSQMNRGAAAQKRAVGVVKRKSPLPFRAPGEENAPSPARQRSKKADSAAANASTEVAVASASSPAHEDKLLDHDAEQPVVKRRKISEELCRHRTTEVDLRVTDAAEEDADADADADHGMDGDGAAASSSSTASSYSDARCAPATAAATFASAPDAKVLKTGAKGGPGLQGRKDKASNLLDRFSARIATGKSALRQVYNGEKLITASGLRRHDLCEDHLSGKIVTKKAHARSEKMKASLQRAVLENGEISRQFHWRRATEEAWAERAESRKEGAEGGNLCTSTPVAIFRLSPHERAGFTQRCHEIYRETMRRAVTRKRLDSIGEEMESDLMKDLLLCRGGGAGGAEEEVEEQEEGGYACSPCPAAAPAEDEEAGEGAQQAAVSDVDVDECADSDSATPVRETTQSQQRTRGPSRLEAFLRAQYAKLTENAAAVVQSATADVNRGTEAADVGVVSDEERHSRAGHVAAVDENGEAADTDSDSAGPLSSVFREMTCHFVRKLLANRFASLQNRALLPPVSSVVPRLPPLVVKPRGTRRGKELEQLDQEQEQDEDLVRQCCLLLAKGESTPELQEKYEAKLQELDLVKLAELDGQRVESCEGREEKQKAGGENLIESGLRFSSPARELEDNDRRIVIDDDHGIVIDDDDLDLGELEVGQDEKLALEEYLKNRCTEETVPVRG
eukprot:g12572.t1